MISRLLALNTILKQIHLNQRFFYAFAGVIGLFVLAFAWPFIEVLAWLCFIALGIILVLDGALLFARPLPLFAIRKTNKRFSLGDENRVELYIQYQGKIPILVTFYDEAPEQFQLRDNGITRHFMPGDSFDFVYSVKPMTRGEYHFGYLSAIASTKFRLLARQSLLANEQMVPVFPSVVQMKKYEMLAFARISNKDGIKKMRRLGHSYEFEKIRQYVIGDDMRSINWKATGRRNAIMVNQYEDERSQQVYFVIDKSRIMQMPFNGMSLLDYAINSTLVLSNIALQKFDKVGLITFANKLGTVVKCESSQIQLTKMMGALYGEKPQQSEGDFETLYHAVKNVVRNRSLLFVFTNFESEYALMRALPSLLKLNRMHLLVVVVFENSELKNYTKGKQAYLSDIYSQTIAAKLLHDKRNIVARLNKHGVQTVLSTPEDLSIHAINKYLELKSKGLI